MWQYYIYNNKSGQFEKSMKMKMAMVNVRSELYIIYVLNNY